MSTKRLFNRKPGAATAAQGCALEGGRLAQPPARKRYSPETMPHGPHGCFAKEQFVVFLRILRCWGLRPTVGCRISGGGPGVRTDQPQGLTGRNNSLARPDGAWGCSITRTWGLVRLRRQHTHVQSFRTSARRSDTSRQGVHTPQSATVVLSGIIHVHSRISLEPDLGCLGVRDNRVVSRSKDCLEIG